VNDCELWELLGNARAAGDARRGARLAGLLEELAAVSLADRWPFFGRIEVALGHDDAAVRAAATRALAGAAGHPGLKAIVRHLDDAEAPVRAAAVAALAASSASDPARWAHAAFSRHADVRVAAVANPPGKRLPWYALLLLPDDACRGAVLDDPEISPVPPDNVFALVDLWRRGLLPRRRAADALSDMATESLYAVLARVGPHRSDEAVDALLAACTADRASAALDVLKNHPALDALDDVLELAWDETAPAGRAVTDTKTPHARFFERLTSWLIDRSRKRPAQRVLAAVARQAARRGAWDLLAAELALLTDPAFLRYKWVPPAVRSASAHALYRYASRLEPLEDEHVEQLLKLPIVRRDDGHLDLWLVGAILRWAGKQPYRLAERVLGIDVITNSFLADPAGSAPLFSIGRDADGRKRLLAAIADRGRHSAASILAGLALVSASDELEFLDTLDGRGAVAVYESLLEMARRPGLLLSENKVRRLSDILVAKIEPEEIAGFLRVTVDTPGAEADVLALRMLSTLARLATPDKFVALVRKLDVPRLNRLLGIIPVCAGFPYAVEARLAHELMKHKDKEVRTWAAARGTAPPDDGVRPPDSTTPVTPLDEPTRDAIATCATVNLGTAIEPCLRAPTVGLCEALARRSPPGMLSIATCVALLGAHDPPAQVAEQFARFSADEPEFLRKLEAAAVKQWSWNQKLPLLGNCWLHLWDPHCFAAGEVLLGWKDELAGALRWAHGLASVVLRRQVFETVARLLELWRYRDKKKLATLDLERLCRVLVDALPGDMGLPAAKALVSVYESKAAVEAMDALQPAVVTLLAELPDPVRAVLQAWIDSRGLAAAAARRITSSADPEVLRRIARSRDLDQLTDFCKSISPLEVQEATLRLVELGGAGLNRLADLLCGPQPPPLADVIAESLPLWAEGAAVDRVRDHFLGAAGSSELLFAIGAALLEREDLERDVVLPALLELCRRDAQPLWFRPIHWQRLRKAGVEERELAVELATSPHAHAYRAAVELLIGSNGEPGGLAAVTAFLRCGTGRMRSLRLSAAHWLHRHGDRTGFFLLLAQVLGTGERERTALVLRVEPPLVDQAVRAVLIAGSPIANQDFLLRSLMDNKVDDAARDRAYEALLRDTSLDAVRARVITKLRPTASRATKLRRLATTFAWGVITGREITGRIFSVEMNAGEGLGYTRLETEKVWITPMPILRGQQHADAVTRGLIVHEFGHHLYHRSPEAMEVWKEATDKGYHGLLNLVSDEHLERNLRALDDRFGDDLKKLAAFAFQHSDKEVPLERLLEGLQGRAFDVLSRTELGAARKRGCVLVNNGRLLADMEKAGLSFPWFVRALRMGLGLRHPDEKVAAGLALFKGIQFRKSSMADLRDLTLKLRDIFGWEAVLMESFGQDWVLTPGASEVMAEAEGITPDEVRDAVRRLLEDRKRGKSRNDKGIPVRQLNLGAEETFNPITTVQPVPFDPAKHAAYAKQVAAPARQMRRYLSRLGLRFEPQRYRVQGKRVDKARVVPAGILRGDPRLLIARKLRVNADLFLGLLVDCSGSMQMSNHLEKAKLFGTLLAEAARGLAGIDVRVFGFTDTVIYDAGDADRCSAHSLESTGGNNDAAALWHAAQAARASRRRAKLLVMISDGAPTECTTSALKALVSRLSARMGMCCAQVAVCPLDVKCFPHYVELPEGQELGESVRKFGAVVTRLVQKAVRA
jgi:hypothetical protein